MFRNLCTRPARRLTGNSDACFRGSIPRSLESGLALHHWSAIRARASRGKSYCGKRIANNHGIPYFLIPNAIRPYDHLKNGPSTKDRFFGAELEPETLINRIDEKINHVITGELPLAKTLISFSQCLGDFTDTGFAELEIAMLILEGVFDVACRQAANIHLDGQALAFRTDRAELT